MCAAKLVITKGILRRLKLVLGTCQISEGVSLLRTWRYLSHLVDTDETVRRIYEAK